MAYFEMPSGVLLVRDAAHKVPLHSEMSSAAISRFMQVEADELIPHVDTF